MFLLSQLKKIQNILYNEKIKIKKYINIDRNGKEIVSYNRPFNLNEYLNLTTHHEE
jgi:hypothetical protein